MTGPICFSVVSHGQGALVATLLRDVESHCRHLPLTVVLTLNVPEELPFSPEAFPFPVILIRNPVPRGFGANHNAAFRQQGADCAYFCVVNPDIQLEQDVLSPLVTALEQRPPLGVVAPLVKNPGGSLEDSARSLPTPFSILAKALGVREAPRANPEPDWVAGMFMVFPALAFARVGGFDEKYHLYYEDVDICCRLRLAGYAVAQDQSTTVIHAARRESHRKLRYLAWHLASMARFFTSRAFLRSWLRHP